VADRRRSIQVATSSGEYSGFDGADLESSWLVRETAIPATDPNLRQTVEDLVESQLRRGSFTATAASGSDNESVTSGVSAEALSKIVTQTVDRMLKDRGEITPRNSTHSTSSTVVGMSPRSSGAFDLPSEPAVRRRDSTGRDSRYIAGNETLEQLLPPSEMTSRARARDRIHRLVSGEGPAITGQRIVVKRDRRLGFGFAISGQAPVYVHSVASGGPCDRGADGLMSGDVILKVGDVPCARSSREVVLDLVDSDDAGDFLYVVVARTPPPTRKSSSADQSPERNSNGRSKQSTPGRSSSRPSSKSPAPFSGWLAILTTNESRMTWVRYWVVLGDGVLFYYDGPDQMSSALHQVWPRPPLSP
jgi:hypothetical protein